MNEESLKIDKDQADVITEVLSESQKFMRNQKVSIVYVASSDESKLKIDFCPDLHHLTLKIFILNFFSILWSSK